MKPFIALILICLLTGCKKEEIDSHQQILGKWDIFYLGNGEYQPLIKNTTAYREFLIDSVLLEHDYSSQTAYTRKYWIDSLLHIGSVREDGYLLVSDYKVQFNADTMQLDTRNSVIACQFLVFQNGNELIKLM